MSRCPYDHTKSTPASISKPDVPSAALPVTALPGAEGTLPTPGPAKLVAFDTHVDPLVFLKGLVNQYGDVTRYRTRFGDCFLFVHPEHVQTILHRDNYRRASLVRLMLGDGLLSSDGPRWLSQRRVMQRDFHMPKVEPFVPVMNHEIAMLAGAWSTAADAGQSVDVAEAMTRLTLRVVVEALFSHDLSCETATQLCEAITQTINNLGTTSWTVFGLPVKFTPEHNAEFAAGKKVIDTVCYDLIAHRRALTPGERPRDLLTLLIETETETGPMDDRQIRDEMVTMLVGGHETTALALAWAWKLLAEHPACEQRLHEEVDSVLDGRPPTSTDLPQLPWSQAVFDETMRLYPPVWYMARVATEADIVHGHAVPRGACVLISPWLTHRHETFWPDPERFDPARFLESAEKPGHRYAYFPFGGGRHQCMGMPFAELEGAIILAQLAQQFRIRPVDGQQIKPNPGITLRQSPPLRATIERRALRTSFPVALQATAEGL